MENIVFIFCFSNFIPINKHVNIIRIKIYRTFSIPPTYGLSFAVAGRVHKIKVEHQITPYTRKGDEIAIADFLEIINIKNIGKTIITCFNSVAYL